MPRWLRKTVWSEPEPILVSTRSSSEISTRAGTPASTRAGVLPRAVVLRFSPTLAMAEVDSRFVLAADLRQASYKDVPDGSSIERLSSSIIGASWATALGEKSEPEAEESTLR